MRVGRVYRELLKSLEKNLGTKDKNKHFRDFVAGEFRKNVSLSDEAVARRELKLAQDYTLLLNSVHHHKELLFSYNIAVDRTDEMRKTLKRSAASVGLQLPDVYQP
ncbi:complex 1 protein, LYR family protein [Wolffia australiana]